MGTSLVCFCCCCCCCCRCRCRCRCCGFRHGSWFFQERELIASWAEFRLLFLQPVVERDRFWRLWWLLFGIRVSGTASLATPPAFLIIMCLSSLYHQSTLHCAALCCIACHDFTRETTCYSPVSTRREGTRQALRSAIIHETDKGAAPLGYRACHSLARD
jgi:hypothetical protein